MSDRDEQATVVLHDMIWPGTGLETAVQAPVRPKDRLGEDDLIDLRVDFVTLSLLSL